MCKFEVDICTGSTLNNKEQKYRNTYFPSLYIDAIIHVKYIVSA